MILLRDVTLTTALPPRRVRAHSTRPYYWSVRRELWEHPWIWRAPTAAAVVLLFLYTTMLALHPGRVMHLSGDWAAQPAALFSARNHFSASMLLLAVGMLVSTSYSLLTLQAERRDRSILFWASLPVSDAVVVLTKAFIAMVFVPALTVVLVAVTQVAMLITASAVLLAHGTDAVAHWAHFPAAIWPAALSLMGAAALMQVPLHAWLLLVSAWARRAALLWATLPVLGFVAAEWLATGGSRVAGMVMERAVGFSFFHEPFLASPLRNAAPMPPFEPTRLGVVTGLLFAGTCIAGAVAIRRRRGVA